MRSNKLSMEMFKLILLIGVVAVFIILGCYIIPSLLLDGIKSLELFSAMIC